MDGMLYHQWRTTSAVVCGFTTPHQSGKSNQVECYMPTNMKDIYMIMKMGMYKYMITPLVIITNCIIKNYNIGPLAKNSMVADNTRKEICYLPRDLKFSNKPLINHLPPYDLAPVDHNKGLWNQENLPIGLIMVVNDFGVKYNGRKHTNNLIIVLEDIYKVKNYWSGVLYYGLPLQCNYRHYHLDVYIQGYINKCLRKISTFRQSVWSTPHMLTPGPATESWYS